MSNAIATKSEANEWSKLLRETRQALSTLRDQDLEELAARAQCMLTFTRGQDPIRQPFPNPYRRELVQVKREHGLLSELLVATASNLEVLRRTRRYGRTVAGEANSQWAR